MERKTTPYLKEEKIYTTHIEATGDEYYLHYDKWNTGIRGHIPLFKVKKIEFFRPTFVITLNPEVKEHGIQTNIQKNQWYTICQFGSQKKETSG